MTARFARLGLPLTLGLIFSLPASAADISEISKDEYHGYAYYKDALEHPKIAKASEKKKLKLVARDLGWRGRKGTKRLASAIEKVNSLGASPDSLAQKRIEEALDGTRVKGRVIQVTVDTNASDHVVAYVRWRGTKSKEVVKEASAIAQAVATKLPMISTISLGAIHPKSKADTTTLVWSAKIAADSAANISPSRIDDYSDRLYKRLFEEIKARPF